MFMRYLGGGIGHLEQFPPANNDNEVVYEYEEDNETEVVEDGNEIGDAGNCQGSDQGDQDSEDEEDDGDGEATECESSDPGESSDEDTGNSY